MDQISETLLPYLPFIAFPLIALLIFWFSIRNTIGRKRRLGEIARSLQLDFSDGLEEAVDKIPAHLIGQADGRPGTRPPLVARIIRGILQMMTPWRITGNYRGARIEIFPEKRGSGKNSRTYTILHVHYPRAQGVGLLLASEGIFTKLGKSLFNLKDIQIGSPDFDSGVRVQAQDEAGARNLLRRPDIQRSVLELLKFTDDAIFQDDRIALERRGVMTRKDEIKNILDRFSQTAQLFH